MIYVLPGRDPVIDETAYVAPSAQVIGTVRLGAGSSVWFGAVLRGDTDWVTVGEGTNVQDGAVLHADPGVPCTLGKFVTVGHLAMVHGCTVGDHSLVGIGAVILNRARIGRCCVIGARALITEDKEIPDYSVVMGSPGKVVRTLDPDKTEHLLRTAQSYMKNARLYRDGLKPDPRFEP
jgi:carbonic anhydrase/acetyltransferase-like protein (isoleucine patch superfamily)